MRPRRAVTTVFALLACSLAIATTAEAASKLQKVGRATGIPRADGGYLVWRNLQQPFELRVYDARTGATRSLASGCPFDDLGAGTVLLNCTATGQPDVRLIRLSDDQESTLAGTQPGETFARVGRYWVFGAGEDSQGRYQVYLNRRSAERKIFRTPKAPIRNIDSRNLVEGVPARYPTALPTEDPPFRLSGGNAKPLILKRGATTALVLDQCSTADPCRSVSLSDGVVTWSRGQTRAYRYVVASKQRDVWRVKAPLIAGEPGLGVLHTSVLTWVRISVRGRTGASFANDLYVAPPTARR